MLEQIDLQIIMRLRQILQEMSRHSKNLLEKYEITIPQLICLQEIFKHGPISLGALTKIVFLNNSTVTGIVDRLETGGLFSAPESAKTGGRYTPKLQERGSSSSKRRRRRYGKLFLIVWQRLRKKR